MTDTQQRLDQALNSISDFVEEQRDRFDGKQNNIFAFRFGDIQKYIGYLAITYRRYLVSRDGFAIAQRALTEAMASHGEGSRELTAEEQALYDSSREQSLVLHLDLETVYVLTTTLLNFLSKATHYYFGPTERPPWRSFTSMKKHLAGYAGAKKLDPPPIALTRLADILADEGGAFRADYISHKDASEQFARSMLGLTHSGDFRDVRLSPSFLYPTDDELDRRQGKTPEEIVDALCRFITEWLAYLRSQEDNAYIYS
jgi:hypothetical protein